MDLSRHQFKTTGLVCYEIMQFTRNASSQTGIEAGTKTTSESANKLRHYVSQQAYLLPTSQRRVERPKDDKFENIISEGQHFEFTRPCLSTLIFKKSLHQNNKLTSS
jgi:hypothetical protein